MFPLIEFKIPFQADKKSAKRLKKTKKVVRKKKSEKGKSKKPTTMRKNIKQILTEQDLTDTTKEARVCGL